MSKNKTTITAKPNSHEIIITREFDAPRELVFKAHTTPELIKQWLGPRGYEMKIDKFEAKDNGHYRYLHTDTEGNTYGFHGVFHEVAAPERIIQTFEFEGMPEKGHVALEILKLEELPGKRTRLTGRSVYFTVEDRDGMIASGMETGVVQGYEQLDEVLAKE